MSQCEAALSPIHSAAPVKTALGPPALAVLVEAAIVPIHSATLAETALGPIHGAVLRRSPSPALPVVEPAVGRLLGDMIGNQVGAASNMSAEAALVHLCDLRGVHPNRPSEEHQNVVKHLVNTTPINARL